MKRLVSVKGNLYPVDAAGRVQENNQSQQRGAVPPGARLADTVSGLSVPSTLAPR